jgi:hypothetical protein
MSGDSFATSCIHPGLTAIQRYHLVEDRMHAQTHQRTLARPTKFECDGRVILP